MAACSTCGATNVPGTRFCVVCGNRILPECASCDSAKIAGHRFCPECGKVVGSAADDPPLPSTGAELSGRRIVTVVFADVSGYTALSEKLDPEDLANLINDFFKALIDPIYRYGGVVDKFIGDAVMALFGAPVAHEDDAVRALRAAFDMGRIARSFSENLEAKRGLALRLRVGVNTGLAVYAQVGSNMRSDFTAMGDTVNLAQRMEAAAEPGHVLVSKETYLLTQHAFHFEAMGAISVKGKQAPVEAFELVGLRSRTQKLAYDTEPFVGRRVETGRLWAAWERALAGTSQFVVVAGEQGVGKSTLVRQLLRRVREEGSGEVRRVRCPSFERNRGYAMVSALLRAFLDLPPFASPEEVAAKLDCEQPGQAAALLGAFENVTPGAASRTVLPPRQLQTAAFLAFSERIASVAEAGPLLLVIEDIHWADEVSQAWLASFLGYLSNTGRARRLMILCQARPQWTAPSVWLSDRLEVSTLALGPMAAQETEALVTVLLGASMASLPAAARELLAAILDRGQGNPFYVTELVRDLVDKGALKRSGARWIADPAVGGRDLPASVRASIAARLDRLDPPLRRLVEIAAIAGQRFDAEFLSVVAAEASLGIPPTQVEAALAELVHLRLLFLRPGGEAGFVSPLVQEVAYETMLNSDRSRLHRHVGAVMERILGNRRTDAAPLLAFHYARAEERGKAALYMSLTGDWARRSFANAEAAAAYRYALSWRESAPDSPGLPAMDELLLRLGAVETALGNLDEGLSCLERRAALAPEVAESLLARGDILERQGDLAGAHETFDRAAREAGGDPLSMARALRSQANIRRRQGHFEDAIALCSEAMNMLPSKESPVERAVVHSVMGICHQRLGDLELAREEHQEALRLREQAGDIEGVANSLNNLGTLAEALGRWTEARDAYARSLDLVRQMGNRLQMAAPLNNLGALLAKQGDDSLAEVHFREVLRLARQMGDAIEAVIALGHLGEVYLARGDHMRALGYFESCLGLMTQTGQNEFSAEIQCARGRALLGLGEIPRAREALANALALAEASRNQTVLGQVRRAEAQLADAAGSATEALRLARESERLLGIGTEDLELARTLAVLGRLEGGDGQARCFERARSIFSMLGAGRDLLALDEGGEASARATS